MIEAEEKLLGSDSASCKRVASWKISLFTGTVILTCSLIIAGVIAADFMRLLSSARSNWKIESVDTFFESHDDVDMQSKVRMSTTQYSTWSHFSFRHGVCDIWYKPEENAELNEQFLLAKVIVNSLASDSLNANFVVKNMDFPLLRQIYWDYSDTTVISRSKSTIECSLDLTISIWILPSFIHQFTYSKTFDNTDKPQNEDRKLNVRKLTTPKREKGRRSLEISKISTQLLVVSSLLDARDLGLNSEIKSFVIRIPRTTYTTAFVDLWNETKSYQLRVTSPSITRDLVTDPETPISVHFSCLSIQDSCPLYYAFDFNRFSTLMTHEKFVNVTVLSESKNFFASLLGKHHFARSIPINASMVQPYSGNPEKQRDILFGALSSDHNDIASVADVPTGGFSSTDITALAVDCVGVDADGTFTTQICMSNKDGSFEFVISTYNADGFLGDFRSLSAWDVSGTNKGIISTVLTASHKYLGNLTGEATLQNGNLTALGNYNYSADYKYWEAFEAAWDGDSNDGYVNMKSMTLIENTAPLRAIANFSYSSGNYDVLLLTADKRHEPLGSQILVSGNGMYGGGSARNWWFTLQNGIYEYSSAIQGRADGNIVLDVKSDGTAGYTDYFLDVRDGNFQNILKSNFTGGWSSPKGWLSSGSIHSAYIFDLNYDTSRNLNWAAELAFQYDNNKFTFLTTEMSYPNYANGIESYNFFASADGTYHDISWSNWWVNLTNSSLIVGSDLHGTAIGLVSLVTTNEAANGILQYNIMALDIPKNAPPDLAFQCNGIGNWFTPSTWNENGNIVATISMNMPKLLSYSANTSFMYNSSQYYFNVYEITDSCYYCSDGSTDDNFDDDRYHYIPYLNQLYMFGSGYYSFYNADSWYAKLTNSTLVVNDAFIGNSIGAIAVDSTHDYSNAKIQINSQTYDASDMLILETSSISQWNYLGGSWSDGGHIYIEEKFKYQNMLSWSVVGGLEYEDNQYSVTVNENSVSATSGNDYITFNADGGYGGSAYDWWINVGDSTVYQNGEIKACVLAYASSKIVDGGDSVSLQLNFADYDKVVASTSTAVFPIKSSQLWSTNMVMWKYDNDGSISSALSTNNWWAADPQFSLDSSLNVDTTAQTADFGIDQTLYGDKGLEVQSHAKYNLSTGAIVVAEGEGLYKGILYFGFNSNVDLYLVPTASPISQAPTRMPSKKPSVQPTEKPTTQPSKKPSVQPTEKPHAIAPPYPYSGVSVSNSDETGVIIVASGVDAGILVSKDLGITWKASKSPQAEWSSVTAVEVNGKSLVATIYSKYHPFGVFASEDFGTTWRPTPLAPLLFTSAAGAGKVLAAVVEYGGIYLSNDLGLTWKRNTYAPNPLPWTDITSDSTGTHFSACAAPGFIYYSVDSGASWRLSDAKYLEWRSITSDASGKLVAASVLNGGIYLSNDYGSSFIESAAPSGPYVSITSDGTGQYLAAAQTEGFIYLSNNFGREWTVAAAASGAYSAISSDYTGRVLAATMYDVGVYVSVDYGATWMPNQPTASPTESPALTMFWEKIAGDGTGENLIASGRYSTDVDDSYSTNIFYSNDFGASWMQSYGLYSSNFAPVAMSTSNTLWVTAEYCGYMFYSTNQGVSWSYLSYQYGCWTGLAVSNDGVSVTGVQDYGRIYTFAVPTTADTAMKTAPTMGESVNRLMDSNGAMLKERTTPAHITGRLTDNLRKVQKLEHKAPSPVNKEPASQKATRGGARSLAAAPAVTAVPVATDKRHSISSSRPQPQRASAHSAENESSMINTKSKFASKSDVAYFYNFYNTNYNDFFYNYYNNYNFYRYYYNYYFYNNFYNENNYNYNDYNYFFYNYFENDDYRYYYYNQQYPGGYWSCVTSDSSGDNLLAGQCYGYLWTSDDAGASWAQLDYYDMCVSAVALWNSGQGMLIAEDYGYMFLSTNGGESYSTLDAVVGGYGEWTAVAASESGQYLAASRWYGPIWVSSDGGVSWTSSSAPSVAWKSLSISSDGQYVTASAEYEGGMWNSNDYGLNWVQATEFNYVVAPTMRPTRNPKPTFNPTNVPQHRPTLHPTSRSPPTPTNSPLINVKGIGAPGLRGMSASL